MKKVIGFLLTTITLFAFCCSPAFAAGEQNALTMTLSTDEKGSIVIGGNTVAQSETTAVLRDLNGNILYLGQAKSGEDGLFSFATGVKSNAFKASVGGEFVSAKEETRANALAITDITVEKASDAVTGNETGAKATVAFANYSDSAKSAVVIFAAYRNNALAGVTSVPTNEIASGATKTVDLTLSEMTGNNLTYKVLVWEDLVNVKPLLPDVEFDKDSTVYETITETVNPARNTENFRVMLISDNHLNSFSGAGGYRDIERQQKMVDAIIAEYNSEQSFDFVIFLGDAVNNENKAPNFMPLLQQFKTEYLDQLTEAGIRYYMINASHDCMTSDTFKTLFGTEKNYVINIGDTSFICADVYNDPTIKPNSGFYDTDIPEDFATFAEKAVNGQENVFMVSHYPRNDVNFNRLTDLDNVLANFGGHTHFNQIGSFRSKPLALTGHFSRSDNTANADGKGQSFQLFTAGVADKDRGNPWCYRMVEENADGSIDTYLIYPAMEYLKGTKDLEGADGAFSAENAFTQPYTSTKGVEGDSTYKVLKPAQ